MVASAFTRIRPQRVFRLAGRDGSGPKVVTRNTRPRRATRQTPQSARQPAMPRSVAELLDPGLELVTFAGRRQELADLTGFLSAEPVFA